MSDIIIYGRGKTGRSLYKMTKTLGMSAIFYDDATGFDGDGKFSKNSRVILSPGVKPTAKGVVQAENVGAQITSELEFCFPYCKGKCISVTGTNGKTTTCEMIYHILSLRGRSAKLLGNGGVPFSSAVFDVDEDDIVVLESSSFQLNNAEKFAPFVSVFTNLACDHLDYHSSFQDYINAKANNFAHQGSGDYAIFNGDDRAVTELSEKCNCRKLFYSVSDRHSNCFFDGKSVVVNLFGATEKADANYMKAFVKHNLSNALAAALACRIVGVDLAFCVNALESYESLPHRLQSVSCFDGVTFVDDSKATNVHATVSALTNYAQPLVLIVGGSDKKESFNPIFENLKSNVQSVLAVGATAKEICAAGKEYGIDVKIFDDISQAVKYGYEELRLTGGGVVLMSNACASFDKFSGYAERGDYFQKVVRELYSGKETH